MGGCTPSKAKHKTAQMANDQCLSPLPNDEPRCVNLEVLNPESEHPSAQNPSLVPRDMFSPNTRIHRKKSITVSPEDSPLLECMLTTQLTQGTPPTPKRPGLIAPTIDSKDLLPPQSLEHMGKRCLVVDLDETLVHAEATPKPGVEYDFVVNVMVGGHRHVVYVNRRPGCEAFIRQATELYEVVVFTASLGVYCEAVMKEIDPNGRVPHHLTREHCTKKEFPDGPVYVKDLSRLGRSLRDTMLLDNNPDAYLFHQANGFPINSWYDDPQDEDLLKVTKILRLIAKDKQSCVKALFALDAKLGWARCVS